MAMLLWVVSLAAGCASAPATTEAPAAAKAPVEVRPGAQAWQSHALELPARSPVVFWTRGDHLLGALGALRDWLFAQPAMFGPNGDQMVARARREWSSMVSYLGMDPLAPASWREMGLDTSRDIYVGMYPAQTGQRKAYVQAFEKAVRDGLGVDESVDLADALRTLDVLAEDDLPSGVHARVSAAVADVEPIEGFRAVVPVADKQAFLDNVDKLMRGAEYKRVDLGAAEGREGFTRHFFYDTAGEWPGVMLRAGKSLALFDIIARRAHREAGDAAEEKLRGAIRARLDRALAEIDAGRPAAPKLPGHPVMGIAVDQQGAAGMARLRGYHLALERGDIAGVAERDAVFLRAASLAVASAANWEQASGKLTGVSYGLFSGAKPERYFRLNITLFGQRGDEPLEVSPTPVGLGVSRRGLGVSMDLGPLSDDAWQRWIGVANPEDLVEHFSASDFDPGLFALSFPRTVALLFANTDKIVSNREIEWLAPVLEQRAAYRRLEIASAGVNMRGLRIQPRMVGLLVLDQELSGEARQAVARTLGQTLARAAAGGDEAAKEDRGDDAQQKDNATPTDDPAAKTTDNPADKPVQPLAANTLTSLADAVPGNAPAYYYFADGADPSYLFFSYGLDQTETRAELDALTRATGADPGSARTVYARAEPVALLSLLTVFEPNLLDPLDTSILAQRLGALVFSVRPELLDGVQTIRYDLELQKPPSLD